MMRSYERRERLLKAGSGFTRAVVIVLLAAFLLFPVIWLATTSFKERIDVFKLPPQWIFKPTLSSFEYVFDKKPIEQWTLNSLIISFGTTILALGLGVPAAYTLARRKFKGKNLLITSILLIRALPPVVILIPFRVLMSRIGLIGTHAAVILIDTIYNAAFTVWLMVGYFEAMPVEIEEAACVDGCSYFKTFRTIALPLAKPGLVTAALFSLILSWNDFLFALSLTSPSSATLPLGILSTYGMLSVGWTYMTAMCTIAIIPILLIALFLQKYYVQGLTFGGVK